MTGFGSPHPLDVDLADLVDGLVDDRRAAQLEAHVAECLLCLVKRRRLVHAPPAGDGGAPLPSPDFVVPRVDRTVVAPASGEIWLAGDEERVLVLVLRVRDDRALVVPVSLDTEAADDEAVVVDADRSPFQTPLLIHPALAMELPRTVLAGKVATLATPAELPDLLAATSGPAISGAADPRLQIRQELADRLGSLELPFPDPAAAEAPPARPEQVRSELIADLRALRGAACAVRALDTWDDLVLAEANGWVPVATLDEVGVVLVVFDTPHGLVDDRDFDAARSVLTRLNASALVVLARELSDTAEVFDSSSLNAGIDMPSGAHTPPRPLISGLAPFDAIAKFLDQHSGARAMSPPTRRPVARVDVADLLREAAAAAVADAVRQGSRFKILPKRRGYESLAGVYDRIGEALGAAFTEGSVVEALEELARQRDEDEDGG
jgi:hypothetical protein